MAIKFGAKNKDNKTRKIVGRLRKAQLITTFGNGAIANMPDHSIIIAGSNYWSSRSPKIHEPNLERMLRVNHFKEPFVSDSQDNIIKPDIPAFRFPYYHFCPKCGLLMPYWNFGSEGKRTCNNGHQKTNIVPSRFMAGCVNGHLEDFPYDWWVHNGNFKDCSADKRQGHLRMIFSDETAGLEHIIIKCTICGKTRSMAGSMGKEALRGYYCSGKRPWLGSKSEHNDPISCKAQLRTVQRDASNVYFPITASALTIPPWSNKLHQELAVNFDKIEDFLDNPKKLRNAIELHFDSLLEKHSIDEIISEITRFNDESTTKYSKQNLLEDEYKVFCMGDYDKEDDLQFKIMRASVPEFLKDFIDDVVLVKRLREVLALRGFRRLIPETPDSENPNFKGYHVDGDCIPLSDEKLNWLPAIEMLGEGIFIKINENKLSDWEIKNQNHYLKMKQNLKHSNIECENFSARYVLLHTLSHLLIRQISFECGYSSAAIKERLYSTYQNSDAMSGILIYTSSSDSDGSLGGLVRNGLPKSFEMIFRNMLNEAAWRSSDPICIQSKSQGYDSLNYAACHACTLLPETSCEMRNCLLDRTSIVGNLNDKSIGLFRFIL